jgi:hypothetical protein
MTANATLDSGTHILLLRIENQLLFLAEVLRADPALEKHHCDGLSTILEDIATRISTEITGTTGGEK